MTRALPALALLGLVVLWSPAQARESAFAAYAEPLRFATASHLLGLRLQALAAAPEAGADAGAGAEEEEGEGPPIPLLALFAGSLAAADPDLLRAVEADLADVHRLAGSEDSRGLKQAVDAARQHLARVREALVPDELSGDPAFRAALIARLAVSERGFGEGYEEAASGEAAAYPLAWLTLQRAEALWTELEPDLEAAGEGVGRAFDELDVLMPSLQPPNAFRDPEDAEGAALDLVFALERALKRPLLIRGFAPALDLMRRQAIDACTAARQGRGRLALENALAARITYQAHLAATLATLAPDVHADLSALWSDLDALRTGDGDDTCAALRDAIARARAILG